jgi:hypothetical protein
MKRLYNARSKYVHEGTSVTDNDALEIEDVCTQVLWALLACSSTGAVRDVDDWLAKMDYLNAARHAGKTLAEDELKAVGVPPDGDRRQTPRVLKVADLDEDVFSSQRTYS